MSKLQNIDNSDRRLFLRRTTAAGLTFSLGAQTLLGSFAQAKGLDLGSSVDVSGMDKPTQLQGGVKNLPEDSTRSLHLVNAHTGDDFDLMYFAHGIYLTENISRFNHLMRDRRANAATNMDTTLYDQLFLLRKELGISDPIRVLSGYRTPETNAKLRSRSQRVAKYSLHMEGRAADIYVPGIPVEKLQQAALALEAGGVGLYSHSNFIHLDTGPVRNWGS